MERSPDSSFDAVGHPLQRWWLWDFVLPIGILFAVTFLVRPFDLEWAGAHFSETEGFAPGQEGFWGWLYEWTPFPAVLVSLLMIVGWIAGLKHPRLAQWRRVFVFVVLTGVIGAGVITNGLLKEYWGRPRPRDVVEFGGRYPFEAVFTIDDVSDGKSFAAGHPTMGFFFIVGYFILRRLGKTAWAGAALVAALAFGGLLGYMRLIQGGHFPTDSVWSAGVMFLTAATLFHSLGLNREFLREPKIQRKSVPLQAKLGGGAIALVVVGFVLLGTPYHDERDVITLEPESDALPLRIGLGILEGEVEIFEGEAFSIQGEAWGHGVPTSRIASRFREELGDDGTTMRINYHQRPSGYLTESNQELSIQIPWSRVKSAKMEFGAPGSVVLKLGKVTHRQKIELKLEPGVKFTLTSGETPVWCSPALAESLKIAPESGVLISEERPRRDGGIIEIYGID